jgi:hypothetical protein
MQVVANISSDAIITTQSNPEIGQDTRVNGQYLLVMPPGVAVTVDDTSTPASVAADAAAELLVRFPMYDHVVYNYFLDSADVAALDLSGAAPQPTVGTVVAGTAPTLAPGPVPRCQVGRGVGPAPVGVAPNSVAFLPGNSAALTPTYGCIITDTEDLTPFNPGNPGADNVMVWWEIAVASTTEDIAHGYNLTAGTNTPAFRTIEKIDQEPAGFRVYISVDDGTSWYEASYLEPTDLVTAGTNLRVAFVNQTTTKYYLLGFALLFQDLPTP